MWNVGQLTLRSERDGILHTIRVEGELDLANAKDLERELRRVESTDALSIVLGLDRPTAMGDCAAASCAVC